MKAQKTNLTSASGVIILLGVISFLGLFLITIYSFSQVGREDSGSYLDRFRAKLLAQAGVERAIKELKNYSAQQWLNYPQADWVYHGEDSDRDGQLLVIEDRNDNGRLDTLACPLELALNPSFAVKDEKNLPVLKKIKGNKIGYSGRVSVTSSQSEGIYAVKVIDTHSQIYINGTDEGTLQLLNNLGQIAGVGDNLGQLVFQLREARPGKKFQVKEELEPLLGRETYDTIKHYITLHSHLNDKVIKPKKLSERLHSALGVTAQPLQVGMAIHRRSQLNSGKVELEPRAPININTAPKIVLMAALTNLSGFYLKQTELSALPDDRRIGALGSVRITTERAEQISERIIQTRLKTPFLEWLQFNQFCDGLMTEGIFGPLDTPAQRELAQAGADVIKSNANPNTIFNEFNPDRLVYQMVDKSDLMAYTTEFCFLPPGFFEIESLGLITTPVSLFGPSSGEEFNLSAGYKVRVVADLFKPSYETHRPDFARGTVSAIPGEPVPSRRGGSGTGQTLQLYPAQSALGGLSGPDIEKHQIQNNTSPLEADSAGQIYLATIQNEGSQPNKKIFDDKRFPPLAGQARGTMTFWFKPTFSFDSDKPVLIFKMGGPKNDLKQSVTSDAATARNDSGVPPPDRASLAFGGTQSGESRPNRDPAPVFELWAYPSKYQERAPIESGRDNLTLRLREPPAGK
ncbi:MAG: hypothetical protein AAB019_04210 [Planctomycetota bacterium]